MGRCMRRRNFIALVTGAVSAAPVACVRGKPIECDASASCSPRTLRQTALVKCVSIPSSLHCKS